MDLTSHVSFQSDNIFIKNAEIFKKDLISRLKWNRQQWEAAGEANSRLNKLCNSLHFWKSKLQPALEDVSIIITLYSKDNDVRVELFEITEAIENLDEDFKVEGIASFRNPRYICFYFKNKEIRDKVKNTFRMLDNKFIVYLSWALKGEDNVIKVNVHWLPLTLNLDVIKKSLDKYVVCVEEERKNLSFMSGRTMPFAKVEFKAYLKDNVMADSIPHLMDIIKMEALITVSGRKPMCLNCDGIGHISKECTLRFCNRCRILKLKDHECQGKTIPCTYADILKDNHVKEIDRDPDVLEDNCVVIEKTLLSAEKQMITDKILQLENQLKATASRNSVSEAERREKKRKADESNLEVGEISDMENTRSDVEEEDDVKSEGSMSSIQDETEGAYFESTPNLENIENTEQHKSEIQNRKEKKHRRKKKKESTTVPQLAQNVNITRCYGKPVLNNARRLQENKKFNKAADIREFVFKDELN